MEDADKNFYHSEEFTFTKPNEDTTGVTLQVLQKVLERILQTKASVVLCLKSDWNVLEPYFKKPNPIPHPVPFEVASFFGIPLLIYETWGELFISLNKTLSENKRAYVLTQTHLFCYDSVNGLLYEPCPISKVIKALTGPARVSNKSTDIPGP